MNVKLTSSIYLHWASLEINPT